MQDFGSQFTLEFQQRETTKQQTTLGVWTDHYALFTVDNGAPAMRLMQPDSYLLSSGINYYNVAATIIIHGPVS